MKICVLGSGSWGTALAQVLADNHHEVVVWGKSPEEIADLKLHRNTKYFPEVLVNPAIEATLDFDTVKTADILLLAVPTGAIEEVSRQAAAVLDHPVIVINVAKGFHPTTHQRLSEVIKECFTPETLTDVVSLIGPSHAEEVILRKLTSVNAVCENEASAKQIQELFSNDYFRVYRGTDVIGSETGVAIKNIMAIASGIITGLGEGDNARAALMTRGLAEMSRYGSAQGGRAETYLGLTGVGDRCCLHVSFPQFQAGVQIGRQDSAEIFWKTNKKTVEGVKAAKVIYEESIKKHISMPITEQVYRVLYEGEKPSKAIKLLMARELKSE
ncbi:MAG: NAD(P)H-dependent glycerol-3-phosphate dehydrogenase [Holdemania filiformis]